MRRRRILLLGFAGMLLLAACAGGGWGATTRDTSLGSHGNRCMQGAYGLPAVVMHPDNCPLKWPKGLVDDGCRSDGGRGAWSWRVKVTSGGQS